MLAMDDKTFLQQRKTNNIWFYFNVASEEQTQRTKKMETDSQVESSPTVAREEGCWRTE